MSSISTIVVCEAQVPFVWGGAEVLVRELVSQCRRHGYQTELVSVPFKWYPRDEILSHAAAWRLLDLSESCGRPIDLVVATKFPTYFVRHPRKVAWLVHQYRAAYELCGTVFSEFETTEQDLALRERIMTLDTEMLGECVRRYSIAQTVTDRLAHYNGLDAPALYHPPRLASRLRAGAYGDYVLVVGRLESIKRVDLVVEAMSHVDAPTRLVVAGVGTHEAAVRQAADAIGVADRITFAGAVDDDALLALYADALAVVFVPYAEDYGYVTLEAFLARRPVITARDSGGPLEFVVDGVNGTIVEPQPEAIADAVNRYASDRRLAASHGDAGYARASAITWDGVVESLVGRAGA